MTDYDPRKPFLPFHNRSQRWSCMVCHRRAGKTVACVVELLTRALATSKHKAQYAYIAPFFAQAKLIAWEYLKSYGQKVIVKTNESEMWVELINGSKIYLFGADNPNRLRGLYLDGCVLDEFADMKPSIWGEIIRPALADRGGWAVFIGTPKGHNAFYDIYQKAKNSPDWFCLMLKASESGLLPEKELIDSRHSMSEDQYAQEFECSFEAAIVGSYYGKLMTEMDAQKRIGPVPYTPSAPVFTVWDLGISDSTAIGFFQVIGKEPRIIDYCEESGAGLDYFVGQIRERKYNYSAHVLPHDAGHRSLRTGTTLAQQLAGMGLGTEGRDLIILPRDDIDPGIELVKQLLPQLWIDAVKCSGLIEALKNYQRKWDDERKVFSPRPLHDWSSNGADMMRYAAVYIAMENPGAVRGSAPAMYQQGGNYGWMG